MTTSQPPFLWHNAVHEQWAHEKLVFLFIASEPTYSRETAVAQVTNFLERHRICAYQIYEVTAPYDLLVRAWVPKRMQRHELKEGIRQQDGRLRVAIAAEVMEVIHHWPWAKSRGAKIGEMHMPTKRTLERELPIYELEEINAVQCAKNGRRPAQKDRPVLKERYRKSRILRRPQYRPGIRFLVLVKMLDPDQWQSLGDRICALLNGARKVIHDPSVYHLDDSHQFLIFGQVNQSEGSFHAISSKLVSQINDYAAPGGARTYSIFFPVPGFLAFRDELQLPEETTPIPELTAGELLQRQEGRRLEVKGSAFSELSGWLRGNADAPETSVKPTSDGDNRAVNSLMRAIASLLNTEGGHVVLGAVEKSKFGEFDRFNELPKVNEKDLYRCCGIECDYRNGEWDEFARLLREVIDKRFNPPPSGRAVKIRHEEIAGKEVCVIDVTAPDCWFWVEVTGSGSGKRRGKRKAGNLEPQFFIRLDNGSRRLQGPEMDAYKQEKPRKGA